MSLVASPKPSSERSAARAARASKIRDDLWAEACRREEALRDLTRLHPGRFPEIAAPEACFALGVSRAALFRLIERFKTEKTVSALPPRKCGRAAGSKNDDPKRDRLIRRTIERLYLTPERASFARLVEEIRLLCVHEGLASPSWRAVRARLAELDLRKHALRRDDKLKIAATKATAGEYRATRPFSMSRSITRGWMSPSSMRKRANRFVGLGSPWPWIFSCAL